MHPSRVALVTCSGKRRVGWHVAQQLAQHGFSLAIHYRSSDAEARETVADFQQRGIDAEAFGADLTDEEALQTMTAEVVARFGRIDVLVNCAAIWWPTELEEVTAADLRQFFEVNTLGSFLLSQQVGLLMTRQTEGGVIVLVGDWATARPYVDYAAYMVSKGSIPTMTRCLAVELGTRNPRVRVNGILPGPVMLPTDLPAEVRERAIEATLVKREGKPENVAQAVWHFIENDFVTGACLAVDGGRSVYAIDSSGS
jgi:pteridine reductase